MHPQPRGENTLSRAGSAPVPWQQQPAVPWSRNLSSIPFPVVICQAASPGSLSCLQGLGRPLAQRSFVPSSRSEERTKEGSEAEPWKHHLSRLPPWEAGSPSWPCRERSTRRAWQSVTDGGTQGLSLSPLWVTNTSQGAESIQEPLVLLQVHLPAGTRPAAQLGGIGAPTSSSHCPRLSIPAGLLSVAL